MTATCDVCQDTGRVTVSGTERRAILQADGTPAVMESTNTSAVLCPCRLAEPLRRGEARWWTATNILEVFVPTLVPGDEVLVTAEVEVPVSADNHRLIRDRGNIYWPAGVNLEAQGAALMLMPSDALRIGWALIAAAHRSMAADSTLAFRGPDAARHAEVEA